jgi:hypothetical protein
MCFFSADRYDRSKALNAFLWELLLVIACLALQAEG